MATEARVARTAHDLTHLNRLRVGGFGISALQLKISEAHQSCTHLPDGFKVPSRAGDDKFQFAPVVEKPNILLRIDDPLGAVTGAKLELFRRGDATVLWTRPLTAAEMLDGEHQLEWDGTGLTVSPQFPDGCVTAQHSPYKLKLTLSSAQRSRKPLIAWTFFHVVLHEIELELGPRAAVSGARDQALYDSLGGTHAAVAYAADGNPGPATAAAVKEVRLTSNLFKTASAQMYDNTAHDRYQGLWDNGPGIPIFAKLYVRKSSGEKVFAPRAVGGVRILWDWEDLPEPTSRHHAKAKAFLDAALDFDKKKTVPRGDNCHVSRHGKRGPAAEPVFPAQAGLTPAPVVAAGSFPFKVERCKTRVFSSLSTAWGTGAHEGKTGVLFQPSRMAADGYTLRAYFAYDSNADGTPAMDTLDVKRFKAPVEVKAKTSFQIWRRVDVPGYRKKIGTLASFHTATFQDYYEKANIRMVFPDAIPGPDLASNGYHANLTAAVGAKPFFVNAAVDPAVDQGLTPFGVQFRAFDDFKTALKTAKGWDDVRLNAWLTANPSVGTESAYAGQCNDWAVELLTTACDAFVAAADGVNVLQFEGLQNQESLASSSINGFAADFASCAAGNKCAFIQCAGAAAYTGNSNRMEQTISHEIGHHLFLPHAVDGVSAGAGPDATSHDTGFHNCTMSYQYDAERKFCGLCILRLRGWDKTGLKNTAAQNHRT